MPPTTSRQLRLAVHQGPPAHASWTRSHLLMACVTIATRRQSFAFTTTSKAPCVSVFVARSRSRPATKARTKPVLYSDNWDGSNGGSSSNDSNQWGSSDDPELGRPEASNADDLNDWQGLLAKKEDGSYWSSFEPSDKDVTNENATTTDDIDTEVLLDTVASLGAEEVEFNLKEADRADKVRQMEEWGFDKDTISSTLGVAVDESLEESTEVEGMEEWIEESYDPYDDYDVDYTQVESHTRVERDEETNEPIRTQHVYVDEHACTGCYNCAVIAQSTFFMEEEHGRARVFSQWGDDQETIEIAIATCPVDCIHYVPYEELQRLEIDRRGQHINHKARLVNAGAVGNNVGGANAFTGAQEISGNMGSRCNNCPGRGCKDCPMYGVGKNPAFESLEKQRKEKRERKRLESERASQNKSADL